MKRSKYLDVNVHWRKKSEQDAKEALSLDPAGGTREPLSRLVPFTDEPVDLADGIRGYTYVVFFRKRGCACQPKTAS